MDGRLTRFSPARAVAVFTLLTLLPLVLLAGIVGRMATRAVQNDVEAHIRTTASVSAGYVQQHMQGLGEVVTAYATRPRLVEAVLAGDDAAATFNLEELQKARPGIQGAFLTDLDGRLTQVVPATPTIVGKDFSFRDWYKGLTGAGHGPYISESYQTAITGNPLVVAAADYVRGADGRPIGIIAATYGLTTIQQFTVELARAQHIDMRVSDQHNNLLAAPPAQDDDGGPVVRSSAPVPGLGWRVEASVSKARAFADVARLKAAVRTLASVLAVVIAAGLVFLYIVLRTLRRREHELAATRDEAVEVSRLKSEFLATMSHEIRTPMNGVIGMLSLLLDGELTDEQRDFAHTAQSSAEALLDVINDILDFSKIEAGKLDVDITEVDLRLLVDDTTEVLASRAQAKGVEMVVDMAPATPTWVRTDPGRLRQILTNLLGNAIKFTAEGEVVVRLTTVEDSDASATIRFDVCDTGIGIAEDQQARLFEAFTQADASTTREYGGTGLGLAISVRLVELLGGRLSVQSEPGQGSTFSFTLTLDKVAAPAPPPVPVPSDLSGMRALVVDDNPTNRMVLEQYLRSWSVEPVSVAGGAEALALVHQAADASQPFAIALLDLNMPQMDGIELARQLRADAATAPQWLVLLTSSAQRGEARKARDAGVDAYLTKPIRQSQLFDCVATLVGAEPPKPTREAPTLEQIGGGALILVAEDNAVNQKVATRMLESLGFRTRVVSNGAEAVEAVLTGDFAAVLMDCQMPVMDGYRATEEIRQREGRIRHTPIIALTAGAMKGDAERCFAAGMDDYVAKPVLRPVLQEKLSQWVPVAASPVDVVAAPTGNGHGIGAFDAGVLSELREMGGPEHDIVGELLTVFLDQLEAKLEELGAAVEAGDDAQISAIAHHLRGGSANLGASTFAETAARLEAAAGPGGDRAAVDGLVAALAAEAARVQDAARAMLAG